MSSGVCWRRSFSSRNWIPWGGKEEKTGWLFVSIEEGVLENDSRVFVAEHLLRVHVEFLPAHGDLFVSLGCFTATHKQKCRDFIQFASFLFTLNSLLGTGTSNTTIYFIYSRSYDIISCHIWSIYYMWTCLSLI